jgi:hypothetical protein
MLLLEVQLANQVRSRIRGPPVIRLGSPQSNRARSRSPIPPDSRYSIPLANHLCSRLDCRRSNRLGPLP